MKIEGDFRMEELKTLKDLNLGYEGYEPEDENIRKQLKEEAIKWFKEISNKCEEYTSSSDFTNVIEIGGIPFNVWAENYEHYGAMSFIYGFFNLTEKDIREKEE